MEVSTFEKYLKMFRESFRYILENNLAEVYFGGEKINFKTWIIEECFGICTSEFEEQSMMENLKEEFEKFIKELKGE